MTAPALELDGVRYRYGATRFRFDLKVEAGEWLAVIGPSGAGKSTLLDIVAGFVQPDDGTLRIAGRDATRAEPAERPLTVLFQDNNLLPQLDAETNVALGLKSGVWLGSRTRAAARDALAKVGLAHLAKRRPAEMSGGERQRVALARALARDRPLLLLDEPFAALGPALREEMLELLRDLREAQASRFAVVMVTHHPEDARHRADRVAFLDEGRIVLSGATADVLGDKADPRLAAYLGRG